MLVLKKTVFTGLCKLEDVIKKAKLILEKHKTQLQLRQKNSNDMSHNSDSESKHSHGTSGTKSEAKYTEINDQHDKIFLLALFSFHIDKIITVDEIEKKQ